MTIRRPIRRLRPVLFSAALIGATLTLGHPGPSLGFDTTDEATAPLGLVRLTAGQTLRVSVADAVGFDPQPDPPGRCALKVGFVDVDGTTIGEPNVFELRSGAGRSVDLSADRAGVGDPAYAYVRPVVLDLRPDAGCRAVVTTELIDRDGIHAITIQTTPVQPPIPIIPHG
jgi:hypothetical protein